MEKIFLSGTFRSRRPSVHFSRVGQDGVCRITPYIMSKGHFPKNILCLRWVMQHPDKDPLMSCPVGLAPTLPSQLFVSYTITTVDMWNVEKYCFSSHSTITTITILGYFCAIKELSTYYIILIFFYYSLMEKFQKIKPQTQGVQQLEYKLLSLAFEILDQIFLVWKIFQRRQRHKYIH